MCERDIEIERKSVCVVLVRERVCACVRVCVCVQERYIESKTERKSKKDREYESMRVK